ncbi:GGDEF domain-containing protein [Deinococcus aquiradiocola]|uniref:GGDEF domain-containing protein n=1 Tax=Deinococcus aquiradiocola TaxID=393059 RepID=A0A917PBN6_9DEIO|nr:GGDEF domain-containing protein [Deinococcus aquiradiocola]GGJ69790.1 hypothetical protein GCM10008939_12710 [Deinococcus aquiradiocola]
MPEAMGTPYIRPHWSHLRSRLHELNSVAALLVVPGVIAWNAVRLQVPGERWFLAAAAVGAAVTASSVFWRPPGQRLQTGRDRALTETAILLSPLLYLIVLALQSNAAHPVGVALLPLLAPTYYARWAVQYAEQPRLGLTFSLLYLCLTGGAVLVTFLRGHLDLDPATVVLLGLLQIYNLSDLRRLADEMVTVSAHRDAALHAARHDTLTGLPNRRVFEEDMQTLAADTPHAVLLLDVDHFKTVNDVYGHDVGDQVLVGLGERLQHVIREHGTVYRWGGEEFVILLPGHMPGRARQAAEAVRAQVARSPVAGLPVTVSGGVGAWRPDESLRENFMRIDAALLRAKRSGRDRVVTA